MSLTMIWLAGHWLVFWAIVMGILVGYDRMLARRRARSGEPGNFAETRPLKYVGLAALFGGLVLPFYFYSVKKNSRGVLIGLGWLVASIVGAEAVQVALVHFVAPVPHVRITDPEDGTVVPTRLVAFGADIGNEKHDDLAAAKSIVWKVDQRPVPGKWDDTMIVRALSSGRHDVSVTVTNWYGNRSTSVIHVFARARVGSQPF